jgi:hypothetical protein
VTDLEPKFPDAWLASSIVKTEHYEKGWELLHLKNGEKVMVHRGTLMMHKNIKDFEFKRWTKVNAD